MTALTAAFSAVTVTLRVGTSPSSTSGSMAAAASIVCTSSGVGGTMGSPSVQPTSK